MASFSIARLVGIQLQHASKHIVRRFLFPSPFASPLREGSTPFSLSVRSNWLVQLRCFSSLPIVQSDTFYCEKNTTVSGKRYYSKGKERGKESKY